MDSYLENVNIENQHAIKVNLANKLFQEINEFTKFFPPKTANQTKPKAHTHNFFLHLHSFRSLLNSLHYTALKQK